MNVTAGAYGQAWQNTACAPATICMPLPHFHGYHEGCCYHPVMVKGTCTCLQVWGGIMGLPWYPVHGQALPIRIVC